MNSTPLTSLLRNTGIISCVALLFSFAFAGEALAKQSVTPREICGYNDLNGTLLSDSWIDLIGGSLVNSPNFSANDPVTFTAGRTIITDGGIAAILISCSSTADATATTPSFIDLSAFVMDQQNAKGASVPTSIYVGTNCITTLYLTNSYSGGTTIDNGEIIIGTLTDTNGATITQGTLGSSSGSLTLTNGAYLDLGGSRQIVGTTSISSDAHILNGMLITSSNSVTYDSKGNIVH